MERVVETLLALARQEAGLDSPAVEPVELAGLVNAQLERLADAARKRQVTFTTRVGGEAWVLADAAACERVLAHPLRSEERRVGKECVRTRRSGCSRIHNKNK